MILSGKYKNKINKVIKISYSKNKILVKNICFLYKNYKFALLGRKIKKEFYIKINKVIKTTLVHFKKKNK